MLGVEQKKKEKKRSSEQNENHKDPLYAESRGGVGLGQSDARGCQLCAYDSAGIGQNKGRLGIGGGSTSGGC